MFVPRVHMIEIRTMEIRLYPNKTQERTMLDTIGHCCFLYNHLLEHCRDAFAEGLRHPTEYDLNKEITAFKKEHPELTTVYSRVLINVSTRVSLAFKGFFRRLSANMNSAHLSEFP